MSCALLRNLWSIHMDSSRSWSARLSHQAALLSANLLGPTLSQASATHCASVVCIARFYSVRHASPVPAHAMWLVASLSSTSFTLSKDHFFYTSYIL